ncbi:MAG TPA: DUF2974 domain-containing protein [Clostridia bacterium]|nr:DUF2974 domain-containing protein [Clostridia bacterium]
MGNIIDYAREAHEDFFSRPLNAVDSLVLSQLAYLHFGDSLLAHPDGDAGTALRNLVKSADGAAAFLGIRDSVDNRALVYAIAASPRFKDIRFADYINQVSKAEEKQFSAVTFLLPDGTNYIAFRGTDSTFVGWKEDFNMSFICPVPAQEEAVKYVEKAALRRTGPIYVGGHSKGGNLAAYAAIFCNEKTRERIRTVFSHDGPGFLEDVLKLPHYAQMAPRMQKTVPESSVVGMLLEMQEPYEVVKSDRIFLMQHDPFSWLVEGNGFLCVETVHSSARFLNRAVHEWLYTLSPPQRMRFVDTLFSLLGATDAKTIRELLGEPRKNLLYAVSAVKAIDEDTRKFLVATLRSLFMIGFSTLRTDPNRRVAFWPGALEKFKPTPEMLKKLRLSPGTAEKLRSLPRAATRRKK